MAGPCDRWATVRPAERVRLAAELASFASVVTPSGHRSRPSGHRPERGTDATDQRRPRRRSRRLWLVLDHLCVTTPASKQPHRWVPVTGEYVLIDICALSAAAWSLRLYPVPRSAHGRPAVRLEREAMDPSAGHSAAMATEARGH